MAERIYAIGVPVAITVGDNGSVTFDVDLTEASDLWEGRLTDEHGDPISTDADCDRDSLFVEAACARLGNHFQFSTPTNPL
jgi:hypothetical protein